MVIRLLVILLVGALATPLFAIGDTITDNPELAEFVIDAIETFNNLETYSAEGATTIQQSISTTANQISTVALQQTITQEFTGQVIMNDGEIDMDMTLNQWLDIRVTGQNEVNVEQTMLMRIIGGDFYVRFDDVKPAAIAAMYPDEWVNLNKDANAFPGAELIDAETFVRQMSNPINFPVNEEYIVSIAELDSESLDDQEMRVITFEVDGVAFYTSEWAQDYGNSFNFQQMGLIGDTNEMLRQFGQGSTIDYLVWIGTDDGLIHRYDTRVITTMDFSPFLPVGNPPMALEQDMTMMLTITGYNEDITISPPEVTD